MNGRACNVMLVRHGETDAMGERRYCGWSDPPLNATGRRQSRRLSGTLDASAFDGVWTSDLARCVETAALAGLQPTVDWRLREINFGGLEMRTWDDLSDDTQRSLINFEAFEAPGGETTAAFRARVHDFFHDLSPGRHLVITHGGVIRLLLGGSHVAQIEAAAAIELDYRTGTSSQRSNEYPTE
jgi:probable phosphoglycerate mutase